MAEETFNPDSMPKTERYQIPYPGPDNLVRYAADQFGAMANAIDTQLGNVDDRQTDAAHATIVRTTLAQLQTSSPVVGQFGYVTDDGDNTGIWCWNGSSWSKVSGATPMTVVRDTYSQLQQATGLPDGTFGMVTDDPTASNNGIYVLNNGAWEAVKGTAGGVLLADTLSQLQSTSAPVGTLAYVKSDPTASNNLVYVRDAANTWQSVGAGSQKTIITSGFTQMLLGGAPVNQGTLLGIIEDNLATLKGSMCYYWNDWQNINNGTPIIIVTIPESMRPATTKYINVQLSAAKSVQTPGAGIVLTEYMPAELFIPCTLNTDGTITSLLSIQNFKDYGFSQFKSLAVEFDNVWSLD